MDLVLRLGQAARNKPISDERGRLHWLQLDRPVYYALGIQRAVARRGSSAGIQRPSAHLWRRVWETGRRAGHGCVLFGDEPVAWRRVRISAQQRFGRTELLR